MHNIIHFYYQNKKKIWKVIIIIVMIIVILRVLNYIAGNKSITNKQNNIISENINQNEDSNSIILNNSLVDGGQLSSTTLKKAKSIIDNFISYCNNGEVEQAYNLLTKECQEELYPTLEIFRNNYWNGFFDKKKICIIENWTGMTYKVTITEDMLTTGNSVDKNAYIEYVTIIQNGDDYKLNINNYIGRTEINKTTEKNDIEIKVISKDTYMDYETYNIQVNNKSKNNVILDNLEENNTIYLQDSKNIKYNAHNYKLQKNDMIINSGIKRNIKITFSNGYTTSRELKYLVFSKLISNYKNDSDIRNQESYTFYINL